MLIMTVCAALSAAGLAVAFLTAYRRRFVAATRIAAFALLPVGLAMAGLVKLGGKVGTAIGDWAADLVLDPTVWTGFAVLAVAVLLYVIARVAGGRTSAGQGAGGARKERGAASGQAGGGQGGAAGAAAPSAPAVRGGAEPAKKSRDGQSGGGDEDFSDIEAILKKHGI
ncbi:hypothetical protein [Streptomyces oceani]|uniref:Cellulose synthase n=1 Tax=Streptomyces oceani TaxID=1075402 RepID=A0A1E7JYG1_9ACTN|nr:hypothetical protein [Streptomyces oceani]OEU96717.1 hypothetical protein AN216_18975 [Streptomyces oceani]